jgi:hypothetical protein
VIYFCLCYSIRAKKIPPFFFSCIPLPSEHEGGGEFRERKELFFFATEIEKKRTYYSEERRNYAMSSTNIVNMTVSQEAAKLNFQGAVISALIGALGLTVALYWQDVIQNIVNRYVPKETGILWRILIALIVTVVIVFIIYLLVRYNQERIKKKYEEQNRRRGSSGGLSTSFQPVTLQPVYQQIASGIT